MASLALFGRTAILTRRAAIAVLLFLLPAALLTGCDALKSDYKKAVKAYASLEFDTAKPLFEACPPGYEYSEHFLYAISAADALADKDWLLALQDFTALYSLASDLKNAESEYTGAMSRTAVSNYLDSNEYRQKTKEIRELFNALAYPLSQKLNTDGTLPSPVRASADFRINKTFSDQDRPGWEHFVRGWEPFVDTCLYYYYDFHYLSGEELTTLEEFPFITHPFRDSATLENEEIFRWRDRCEDWIRHRVRQQESPDGPNGAGMAEIGLFFDENSNSGGHNDDDIEAPTDFAAFIAPFYFADNPEAMRYHMRFEKEYVYYGTYTDDYKGYSCVTKAIITDIETGEELFSNSYTTEPLNTKWSGSDYYAPFGQAQRTVFSKDIEPLLARLFD